MDHRRSGRGSPSCSSTRTRTTRGGPCGSAFFLADLAPVPQRAEREDAGAVAVAPREADAPVPDQLGVEDRDRVTLPGDPADRAEVAAAGARAAGAQVFVGEEALVAVPEHDRQAPLPLDVDLVCPRSVLVAHGA